MSYVDGRWESSRGWRSAGRFGQLPKKEAVCVRMVFRDKNRSLNFHSCVHALSPTGADFIYRSFVGPSRLKT